MASSTTVATGGQPRSSASICQGRCGVVDRAGIRGRRRGVDRAQVALSVSRVAPSIRSSAACAGSTRRQASALAARSAGRPTDIAIVGGRAAHDYPPEFDVPSPLERSGDAFLARSIPAVDGAGHGLRRSGAGSDQRLVQDRQRQIDLICRGHERRDDADDVHVGAGCEDYELARKRFGLHPLRQVRIG